MIPDWWTAAWDWLANLKGGAPQFLGALTGSLLGLLSILAGALYNAHLNRKRDDRLRREDVRLVIAALRAELSSIKESLLENAQKLEDEPPEQFFVPDIAHSIRLLPEATAKIGLLGEDAIGRVMRSFLVIEEYASRLVLLDGVAIQTAPAGRRIYRMQPGRVQIVARLNRITASTIDDALKKLGAASRNLRLP